MTWSSVRQPLALRGAALALTFGCCGSSPTSDSSYPSVKGTRLSPCDSQATLAGEIAHDGSIRFTVTQARWDACTPTGTNACSGVVNQGTLFANGRVTVQCDDGRNMVIDEQLGGSQLPPPTTPG